MGIWFKEPNLEEINSWSEGTIVEHIGIKITDIGEDYIEGTMPADHRNFFNLISWFMAVAKYCG